jgi:hypothetical protein
MGGRAGERCSVVQRLGFATDAVPDCSLCFMYAIAVRLRGRTHTRFMHTFKPAHFALVSSALGSCVAATLALLVQCCFRVCGPAGEFRRPRM